MRILLDTSAYVGFKRNVNQIVEAIVGSDEILFSPIVLGELFFGFRNGTKFLQNMGELNEFLRHPSVSVVQISGAWS